MNKTVLIAVIVIVLIAVVFGIYLIVVNSNPSSTPGTSQNPGSNATSYMVEGTKIEILKQGTGNGAVAGNTITVNYVGTIAATGKKFDSSIDRNSPFTFVVGKGNVIKGFDAGLLGAKVGEKRRLTIPPESAYGATGIPNVIPPNSTLIYEVDILAVNK